MAIIEECKLRARPLRVFQSNMLSISFLLQQKWNTQHVALENSQWSRTQLTFFDYCHRRVCARCFPGESCRHESLCRSSVQISIAFHRIECVEFVRQIWARSHRFGPRESVLWRHEYVVGRNENPFEILFEISMKFPRNLFLFQDLSVAQKDEIIPRLQRQESIVLQDIQDRMTAVLRMLVLMVTKHALLFMFRVFYLRSKENPI